MHYLPQSCRPRMQEQVGWAVLTQALTGCSLLGLDWSSSLLSDGPRPGDPLPRRFSQVASKLELPSWFLFMWALRRAARVSFQYGSWLLSEKMIQKAKAERAMHFITQAWVSHTVTSTIFNGSHQPALIQHRKGLHRTWVPGGCRRGWPPQTLTHRGSFPRSPGPFSVSFSLSLSSCPYSLLLYLFFYPSYLLYSFSFVYVFSRTMISTYEKIKSLFISQPAAMKD